LPVLVPTALGDVEHESDNGEHEARGVEGGWGNDLFRSHGSSVAALVSVLARFGPRR
jgi:hypothetical protein